MSVMVHRESCDLLVIRVSGVLTMSEWLSAQQDVAKLMPEQGTISLLIVTDDFDGWGPGDWQDTSFQRQHDRRISRMAIVSPRQWEDLALLFVGQGLRKFEIEYFPPSQIAQARQWLAQNH